MAEMDQDQYRGVVKQTIADAVDYIDTIVAPDRERATKYYRGDPFGNEEAGRSQIVMTEVRDSVLATLPSLLRIFTSSEKVCEFSPRTAEKVEQAAQQTDYVNYIFYNDNPGFLVQHSAFKDGLVRKVGFIKWRWSFEQTISEASFTGLDEGQYQLLVADPAVEVLSDKTTVIQEGIAAVPPDAANPMGVPAQPAVVSHDIKIRRTIPANQAVVEAVPPEEILVKRDARSIDDGAHHRSYKRISELVAMGYDADEIEEYGGGSGSTFDVNTESQARNPAIMSPMSEEAGEKKYLYVESYIHIDKDGDGIAELRKICTIGDCYILHDEVTDEVPIAPFCPDPEPHMVIGNGMADWTMDLQLLKSNVVRNTLDSLSQSIHPETWFVEGQANPDDVTTTGVGKVVRLRQPGMYGHMETPFVGQASMPIIAWLDQVKAQRTGISPASQGLSPDLLQSTEKSAVTATVTGAQERTEMIARIFAETGMKRVCKGLLRLVVKHQDKPRMIRLRGKWVEIDPRYWDADADVQVNVALGRGTDQDRMMFLIQVLQKQELILQTLGPMNPVVSLMEYWNTLDQLCSLAGFKDTTRYFKQPTPEAMQAMAQQPPRPDPNMMLVEIEKQKAQADIQIKQAKLQQEAQIAQMEDAREKEKMNLEHQRDIEQMRLKAMVDVAKIEAETKVKLDMATLSARVDLAAEEIDAETKKHNARVTAENRPTPDA